MKSSLFTLNGEQCFKYEIEESLIDDLQYSMLENNNIEGLLECRKSYFNGDCSLIYKLDMCIPFKKYYESGEISDEKIIDIFIQINEIILSLKEYFLLESKNIDIEIDKVYFDYKYQKIKLIYVPNNSDISLNTKYIAFINEFISVMNIEDKHTRFINNLKKYIGNQFFSIQGFNDFLKEERISYNSIYIQKKEEKEIIEIVKKEENKKAKESKKNIITNNKFSLSNYNIGSDNNNEEKKNKRNIKKEDVLTNSIRIIALQVIGILIINLIFQKFSISNGLIKVFIIIAIEVLVIISLYYLVFNQFLKGNLVMFKKEKKEKNDKKDKEDKKNFKEKIYYSSDETCFNVNEDQTIFGGDSYVEKYECKAYLLNINDISQEKIFIDKKSFIIGREKTSCDYYIVNKQISKMHLEIVDIEDELFIKDLNSTNGTYLNEKLIESNKLVKIFDKDIVKIVNMKYIFKIN